MRGWDQPTLAARAGTNQSLVSQVERGRRDPTPEVVAGFARAFGVTEDYLRSDRFITPATEPWLRAYADASRRETARRVAAATTAAEYIDVLGLHVIPDRVTDLGSGSGPDLPGASLDPGDMDEVDDLAAEVRELLGFGEGAVVSNMIRATERLGCIVVPLLTDMGRHMGMSLHANQLPMIFVPKTGVPGDRQRFSAAHELGHLVLHSGFPPPRTVEQSNLMERQANRFAAAFLTPADAVVETLHDVSSGRITLSALAEVKARWGVAIKMLVGRYRSLGLLDDDQARSLYKQISARKWTYSEPVDVPLEDAQWFTHRICEEAGTEDLATATHELAASIGGNGDDLLAFADWAEPEPAAVARIDDWRS